MRKILTAILSILTLSIAGLAQSGGGKVIGNVIDGNTKTIESATITLLRAKDSTIAKVSVADRTGRFVFEEIRDGKYMVSV